MAVIREYREKSSNIKISSISAQNTLGSARNAPSKTIDNPVFAPDSPTLESVESQSVFESTASNFFHDHLFAELNLGSISGSFSLRQIHFVFLSLSAISVIKPLCKSFSSSVSRGKLIAMQKYFLDLRPSRQTGLVVDKMFTGLFYIF